MQVTRFGMFFLLLSSACVSSATYGRADFGHSLIWLDKVNVANDGNDSAQVHVLMRRDDGSPLPGIKITLNCDYCIHRPIGPSRHGHRLLLHVQCK